MQFLRMEMNDWWSLAQIYNLQNCTVWCNPCTLRNTRLIMYFSFFCPWFAQALFSWSQLHSLSFAQDVSLWLQTCTHRYWITELIPNLYHISASLDVAAAVFFLRWKVNLTGTVDKQVDFYSLFGHSCINNIFSFLLPHLDVRASLCRTMYV